MIGLIKSDSLAVNMQRNFKDRINHLASIVEQSSEVIISRGLDQRMISWNRGAEVLLGYSKEEALGKTARELGMIRFSDKEIEDIEQQILEKGNWKAEKQYYQKNGSSFFGEVIAYAVKNEDGDMTSIVFIIKDISLRKQLEEQRKKYNEKLEDEIKERTEEIIKNEKRFRVLFESSHDIISLVDASYTLIYRSPSAKRITGWTDEDLLGKDSIQYVHMADKERISQIVKEVSANPGKPIECLVRSMHKKGHYLWLEGVVINLLQDEAVKAIVFNFRDVTARIESDEKLATSEKLFRTLIENNNDIITLMDDSFIPIYRSPRAAKVTGWTNEEMFGMDATKNIHIDDKPYAAAIIKEVMANPGKTIETKFRMLHKDGHYLWVEGTLTNLLNDTFIKAVVFNYRNITRRVEAEEKLTASEKQFRYTLDNMLEGVQILDFNWRFIYVNDALVRSSKSSKEVLLGNTLMEKYPGIDQTALFNTLQRCMTERISEHLETEITFPDGTKANYELSIQPVPEGIFILSIDITDRTKIQAQLFEREKQLELFIEHSPASLAMFDTDMKYIAVSRRWITDYRLGDQQLIGKFHYDIFPEISQRWKEIHQHCLEGAIEKKDEDAFQLPDGSISWLRWEIRPWQKASGEIGGIIIFTEDISEKKIAEQQREFNTNNLDALINNTNDMLWSVDRDYKLITSNKAFDKIVNSMTGKYPVKSSSILLNEFSNAQLEKYKSYYQRAFSGETFTEIEHDSSLKDFWSEISFNPIYEGTSVIGTACHSRNISEKKKAEQELKRSFDEKLALAERMAIILNTLPANIALLDGNGCIVDVNDSWRNFALDNGLTQGIDCIGINYLEISKNAIGNEKEDGRQVARGIESVLKNKAKEFVFEYACHSPKTKRWFRMVVSPLLEKEYAGAVVMHIDISEIRRLEQERLKAKTEEQKKITKAILRGEERERNHIGQELHDNVNQILVGTKIYLTMAGNKNKEISEIIKYPLDLIDSSINEIRSLCHKMVNPLNNIELEELIRGLLNNLGESSKIKTEFMYSVATGILSEDLQLNIYRIIQELANNVLKYAGATNISIMIKSNRKHIAIIVTDNGRGFDPTRNRKGIGILNMTNRVKSFNGEIEIKSSEGNGCRTSISIPY